MSFIKAKVHVSVCKDYIDFYESRKVNRLEGNYKKKELRKSRSNTNASGICKNRSNDDKNKKREKDLDNVKESNRKTKTGCERRELKKTIGKILEKISQSQNGRCKRGDQWTMLDGMKDFKRKIIINKVNNLQGSHRYLRFNSIYHRKLCLGIMLAKRKRAYLNKELSIRKKKMYKKKQKKGSFINKDFNDVIVKGKTKNREKTINVCMLTEDDEDEKKEKCTNRRKGKGRGKKKKKSTFINKEKANVKFSEMNIEESQNVKKKSDVEENGDAYGKKSSGIQQIEENVHALEGKFENEPKIKCTELSNLFKCKQKTEENLKNVEERLEILERNIQIAEEKLKTTEEKIKIAEGNSKITETNGEKVNVKKNYNIENKLMEVNCYENKNCAQYVKSKRMNFKRNTKSRSGENCTNKRTHREICIHMENKEKYNLKGITIEEKETKGEEKEIMELYINRNESNAELKDYPLQKIIKKETEIKNDGKNKNIEEEMMVEQKMKDIWKKQKNNNEHNKKGESSSTNINEHAKNRVYNSTNMSVVETVSENELIMKHVKEPESSCILETNMEMQKEKTEKTFNAEKYIDLKDVNTNFNLKKEEVSNMVWDKVYKENTFRNSNNTTDILSNVEYNSDKCSIKKVKQSEDIEIIGNFKLYNGSSSKSMPSIENAKENVNKNNSFVSEDVYQNKMEEIKQQLLKKEDIILKEIKRKEENEIIHLNFDSSFYSPKGAGLHNRGQNICFFNSIIQSIIRIPYICKDLINKLHSLNCEKRKKKIFCFFCLFEQLACNIISRDNVTVNNVLVAYLRKYVCSGYKLGYQEDVHEYLRYFLSSLENCSIYSAVYIQKMFTGVTKNVTICIKCNTVSLKYEQYYELSLDISSTNNLEDALKKFLSKEILEGENGYFCDKCQKKTVASKQCVINKLPRILTIQIKRFFMNHRSDIVKSHKAITYPLYLDMRCFLNKYDQFENSLNKRVVALYEKTFLHKNPINPHSNVDPVELNKNNTGDKRKEHATSVYRYNTGCDKEEKQETVEKKNINLTGSCRNNLYDTSDCRTGNHNWHPPLVVNKLKGGNSSRSICILKEIEHIFTNLSHEISQKNSKKQLSVLDLKTIIIEKKKLILKSLSKIRFSKIYDDLYVKICRDLSKMYYLFKNNLQKDDFVLKTHLFKYRFDDSFFQLASEIPDAEESDKHFSTNCTNRTSETSLNGKNDDRRSKSDKQNKDGEKHADDERSKNDGKNYFHFELTGLIKHIGSGTEYGHYVALTKSKNNYLECDDRNVTYIKEKDMLSCIKNAYVFVYTCINPHFIDFYNKYIDVFEKNNFGMNLPVFEKNVEFKGRITMPEGSFVKSLLY